ncbi:RNA polymerase sigma factor [Paenibacillus sp. NPDC058071]|uniref:RNA polymerase sigma factor n=1 Tax=Paenibacillus sp. NPDC058071 TaxID=3346326 RepID=UPI0036D8C943
MSAEREMIGRLRNGDGSALEWLMERYGNDLLRTATLLLKDRHLAEDVCQDVFIDAYRKIGQLKADDSARSWLLAMTVNRCRERMRLFSWKKLLFPGKLAERASAAAAGTEEWVVKWSMRQVISALPFYYREAIVLHYYQDLTVSEMAALLREPESTVKSRLQRGRRLLKRRLEEGGWQDEAEV